MKLLILLSRVPYPLEKGDKLRAFHLIKRLSIYFDIYLFALNDGPLNSEHLELLKPYCKAIKFIELPKIRIALNLAHTLFTKVPFQVGYFYSEETQELLDQFIEKHQPDIVYCQLIRTAQYARKLKHLPKVIDYMDAFSKGMERRAQSSSIFLHPILNMEHKRLINYERDVFDDFEMHTIISEQDKKHISHPLNHLIKIVKNGIDTDYFFPQEKPTEYDILFAGNMNYPPNIDSAIFLVKKVLPIVQQDKRFKNIKVMIAGANPHKKVQALKSSNVEITGWVDDIRSCYAACSVFVAPMQLSIGLQNKLLEAMAMKRPCITSPLANNAVGAIADESILLASTPEDYAKQIITLLSDPVKARDIAEKGYRFVRENYNWDSIIASLTQNIKETYQNFHKIS